MLEVLQVSVNIGALIGGAVIWRLYVGNLKAALTAKSAEISSVEKNRDMWRDQAHELEKRSPEFMERILSERVHTRESEIARLAEDKDRNLESLAVLQREKANIESDLLRTQGFRLMLALEEGDETEPAATASLTPHDMKIQVVYLGEVAVDSGLLMITDPCYIDDEWERRFAEDETNRDGPSRRITADPTIGGPPALPQYSFRGACETADPDGYGELGFNMGHAGAGVAFRTAWGDGGYRIYGELHDGRIIRAYINLG